MPQFEFPLLSRNTDWHFLAANGGLVCFRSFDCRRILDCYPMTNRWKELPPGRLDGNCELIVYMIVDEQRSSYKMLFAGNTWPDPRCGLVDSYDSITNTWSPVENSLTGRVIKSVAYCSGEFYVLTQKSPLGPHAIWMLGWTTLRWRDKIIPVPEGFEIFPYIVECSGCVYLVAKRGVDPFSFPISDVGVFQLDPSNHDSRWIQVSEKDFGEAGRVIYGYWSHGSKISVGMWECVAIYDCITGVWEEIFKGSTLCDMREVAEAKDTFQPNLRVAP